MRSCGAVDLQSGWLGGKKELKSQFCLLLSIDLAALSDEFGSSTWMYFLFLDQTCFVWAESERNSIIVKVRSSRCRSP